ncbi:hypothetical protein D9758_009150 [Tetrapyrgos nigripes]|uniref:MYND-type domain-containing protein n=1 Tax=Tetrapyrgos nigripes TaxID=182062 RepID=A0A8H5G8D3_9AGAR|nr:hypothetical protein D9758_009150 [Tetrapyrgos nigripes]
MPYANPACDDFIPDCSQLHELYAPPEYHQFRLPIPSPSSVDPSDPSPDMKFVLSALGPIAFNVSVRRPGQSQRYRLALLLGYERHWSRVWNWTSFLVNHFVLGDDPETEEGLSFRDALLDVFPKLLALYFVDGSGFDVTYTRSFMQKRSDVFPLIIQVLSYALHFSHPSLHPMLTLPLDVALAASGEKPLRLRNATFLIRSPDTVNLLFSYISTEIQKSAESDSSYLQNALRTIWFLTETKPERKFLSVLILSRDAIGCLASWCRTLVLPSRLPVTAFESECCIVEDSLDSLKHVLHVLCLSTSMEHHRYPAMALLLRGGIIQSWIYAGRLISYDETRLAPPQDEYFGRTVGRMFFELLGDLPSMLGCHKIFGLVSRSLRACLVGESQKNQTRREALEFFLKDNVSCSPNLTHKALGELWERLVAQVAKVEMERRTFEQQGLVVCGYPKCPHRGTYIGSKIYRMRCARCKTTVYCSQSCQKRDWKNGNHRVKCNSAYDVEISLTEHRYLVSRTS